MTWSLINPLVSSYRGGVDGCIERSFFLSLLICLGLLFPAIPAPASEEDSAFHQHLGNRALIEKRYDEAQSEFEKGWHLDSTRARSDLLTAYAHNPKSSITARLLNRLYHETGDYGLAAIWHSQRRSLTNTEDRFEKPEARIRHRPKLVKSASPRYPKKAKQAGVSGRVFVKFRISRFGQPDSIAVLKGHELLRDEAVGTIKRMRFSPAITEAGDSVSVWMSQVIAFR